MIDSAAEIIESAKTIYDLQNRNYDKNIYIYNITSGGIISLKYHIFDEEGKRILKLPHKVPYDVKSLRIKVLKYLLQR